MKVVILCGGQGTRIRDVDERIPKPMLPIGEKPILWHIMKLYAAAGFNQFVLCLGYKGWAIKEFFLNYQAMISDFTVDLKDRSRLEFHSRMSEEDWQITLADTGENTMTGGRVAAIRKYVEKDDHFFLTYGDGLADIDIHALYNQHLQSGLVGTITGVRVGGRFGEIETEANRVVSFSEKPAVSAGLINGGFMIFDAKRAWSYIPNRSDLIFEREPLTNMVADKQLGVFEHKGYWQCMDTFREHNLLNELWASGQAPWKID